MDSPFFRRRGDLTGENLYRHKRPALIVTLGLIVIATLGALQFKAPDAFGKKPFASFLSRRVPLAAPSASAFGESGGVLLKFAMPGDSIQYPLDVHGDPSSLEYSWVRLGDSTMVQPAEQLSGAQVNVPDKAGFYRLALVRGERQRVVGGQTGAVLVPFKEKEGVMLNGYRIGTYLGEKIAGNQDPPEGF